MQTLLRLCLWQAIILGILITHFPVSAEEERGIRMRGPKSSDVFPYDRYGPITSKDTLWNIATRVRPDNRLSVYQVMQALYQENSQAFVDSNINHLVEGQYLKIPSFNNMMAVNTSTAKKKSAQDSKAWQKSQPKKVKKVIVSEPSVNKKDLDSVKTEINDQLQKIDGQQQKRLATIQNDISDSINGLQAILKENENLRKRLSSFSDKLGVMQGEVAKGKEIKLKMDDMIKLQQALLAKAEAREQQLLLEKQQAELAEQDITSSLWFKIAMGTLPAILLLGLLAFLFKRRQQASDEVFFNELDSKKQSPSPQKESEKEELSLDDELTLDDELSLDDELNLDDELSLDDELNLDDELSLEDELSLDDDLSIGLIDNDELLDESIHLDDDDNIDELDDLEDILLDDEADDAALDGGELDQGDLDSLLSGLDDELEENDELEGGELNQDDLNDLLSGLDDDLEESADVTAPEPTPVANVPSVEDTAPVEDAPVEEAPVAENADVTDPDDIDALLAEAAAPKATPVADEPPVEDTPPVEEAPVEENADVTDPDDIDALLAASAAPEAKAVADEPSVEDTPSVEEAPVEDNADVTDPDDIDALLAAAAAPEATPVAEVPSVEDTPPVEEAPVEDNADVTDPDDIDALLAAAAAPEATPVAEVPSVEDTPPVEEASVEESGDVTDPDDIDALLAAATAAAPEAKAVTEVPSVEDTSPVEEAPVEESGDATDPDDIDALLAAAAAPEATPVADVSSVEDTSPVEEATVEKSGDVTDADDIDALLAAAAAPEATPVAEVPSVEDTPPVEEAPVEDAPVEESADVTDPDDIDALLAAAAAPEATPVADVPLVEDTPPVEESADVTDPDDIDALLAAAAAASAPAASAPVADEPPVEESADVTDPDDIDALLAQATGSATDLSLPDEISTKESSDDIGAAKPQMSTEGSTISAEDKKIQDEIAENEAKIAEFTAEYVTPFLTADFSDIIVKEGEPELLAEDIADSKSDIDDDELDIDTLIAEAQNIGDSGPNGEEIGDSLTGDAEVNLPNKQHTESLTESALSQLLTDVDLEEASAVGSTDSIGLAPDFSDEEVLAELLAETEEELKDEAVMQASAKDVIEELDNVDFDELLANIEEESTTATVEQGDVELSLDDIGDDLIETNIDKNIQGVGATEDYVSVDDLLSETLDEVDSSEPYEKTNIDVGLGQFAENDTGIDVDVDGSMSSKLDLAKMYIEMGDEESAQVVLQDVISKGDAEQQLEAKKTLDSL